MNKTELKTDEHSVLNLASEIITGLVQREVEKMIPHIRTDCDDPAKEIIKLTILKLKELLWE